MSPHIKRWITGIIAVPILVAVILYSSEGVFTGFIIIVILGAVIEYNRMVFNEESSWEKWEGLAVSFFFPLAAFSGDFRIILAVITCSVISVFILFLLRTNTRSFDFAPLGTLVLGFMYIPFMLSHFILIRKSDDGIVWIFLILVFAFSGDIAAYYVGRMLGKKKLLPSVSPGKTVEGTIALLIGCVVGCLVFRYVFYPKLSVIHAVIIGLWGGILGQLGDLCESLIKRASGVKDSGSFLIGHGGLLDRLDCLIFIAPLVYYYRLLIIA
jgi:phosphatidate cytidylyltransferase